MSFAPDSLLSNGSGGSPSGSMSALGGLAGSLTSGVANQLGPLAGLAGTSTATLPRSIARAIRGRVTQYHMTVVPWFWFLTRSTDCRIFQKETAQEILSRIFQEHGFSYFVFDIQTSQNSLEYVVMY